MPDPPASIGNMPSLYANLLNPTSNSSSTSIQRAPIVFKPSGSTGDAIATASQDEQSVSSAQKKLNAAALRFQPTITKRPQASTLKAKPKVTVKAVGTVNNTPSETSAAGQIGTVTTTAPEPARPVVKTTLDDWAHTGNSDDDVNGFYAQKERERERRRKKRRKNKEAEYERVDWDDIYDPSRPNNYDDYKDSEEREREMKEWRERLYGRRRRTPESEERYSDEEEEYKPVFSRFAPPPTFAPPLSYTAVPPPAPPAPAADVPDDTTGEEAYLRRVRMSQQGAGATLSPQPSQPPPPPVEEPAPPPEPYIQSWTPLQQAASTSPTATPPSYPTLPGTATISRAPVIYKPVAKPTTPVEEEDIVQGEEPYPEEATTPTATRSLRPGQKGFAHRLLQKYGWTEGTGLGASNSGIVKPLQVVTSKKEQAGHGKIIDKNKKKGDDGGKFGKMTEVIVLKGMLKDIAEEEIRDGELIQEIGEECGEKYGRVERVVIKEGVQGLDEEIYGPCVFVAFTSQLSALRAVNALEGRLFNGNTIEAKFYDKNKFEKGIFSLG